MRTFLVIIFLLVSFSGKSCPINNLVIDELVLGAKQIFKGAVTQVHWYDYEKFIKSQVTEKNTEKILLRDKYTFKTVPVEFYKGSEDIPETMYGGGCYGFWVEGRNEYFFFVFDDPNKNIAIAVSDITPKELQIISTANKAFKQDK